MPTAIIEPERLTDPAAGSHFFGYYTKSQWNPSGRCALAHRAGFDGRMPGADDRAEIGVIDEASGNWTTIAETRAWNWQTGSHLEWLDDERLIFNDRRDDGFRAVIADRHGREHGLLARPVAAVHGGTGLAASIDFARLAQARPVLGYAGGQTVDLTAIPDDDGCWVFALDGSTPRLLLSLADCVALADGPDFDHAAAAPAYAGRPGYEQPTTGHRLGGAGFSPGGRYLLINHHWPRRQPLDLPHFQRHVWDRVIIYDLQEDRFRCLGPDGFYSHLCWMDDQELWAWCLVDGQPGLWSFDVSGAREPERLLAETVSQDPHGSLSPNRRWFLGDGYPNADGRPLYLVDLISGERHDLGCFATPAPWDKGPVRCDLHPRWSPDGRRVSFDSAHEGSRQCYAIDLERVIR